MATIRKRGNRWQVQVRRVGHRPLSNSFLSRKDAEAWARQAELGIDRTAIPHDPRHLERYTLGELVIRYRDTITPLKRSAAVEKTVLDAFLRQQGLSFPGLWGPGPSPIRSAGITNFKAKF